MFKNYYIFQQQISEISQQISGATIDDIYTVHKNELIFDLKKEEELLQLAISISQARPYILLHKHINHKGARYNKFEMLYGHDISGIAILPDNKFIKLELADHTIDAFFYSKFPNIMVYDANGLFLDSFKALKSEPPVELLIQDSSQKNDLDIQKQIKIISATGLTIKEIIRKIFPASNKQMLKELYARLECNEGDFVKDLNIQDITTILSDFYNEIYSGKAYIYRQSNFTKYLLLYRSTVYNESDYDIEKFDSVNKAWNIFTRENQKDNTFEKLITPITKAINKRKHMLERTLSKLAEAEDIESRKQEADLKGNLILTNKHKIPRSVSQIELENIFSDQREKIKIKLNPKKTAVENATYYFEKYKNIAEKKQVISLKKSTCENELNELKEIEKKTNQASIKELLAIKEQLEAMNVLQAPVLREKTKQSLKYAFKRLILENAWDIYIGKNNQNNEQLTFEFANKWDIWLHAQGVSGSHVIIKLPTKSSMAPRHIIEQAAQIAAFNSKARHSSTVPVIYSQVRFVSKIRGAQPGTVNVKNEKVIFVKPLNLNQ